MKNAIYQERPSVLFRLLLCALLVWGLAPQSALAEPQSSEGSVVEGGMPAEGGLEAPGVGDDGDDAFGAGGTDGAAADESNTADSEDRLVEESASKPEALNALDASLPEEGNVVPLAAVTSFAALQSAVAAASPGATIEVAGEIVFTGAIDIDKPLTIKADGSATLVAASGFRHFNIDGTSISGGSVVAFEGVDFVGPSSKAAAAENGGIFAINVAAASLAITDCTFTGNQNNIVGGFGYGGAVSVATSIVDLTFTGCTFTGNGAATTDGGAIAARNAAPKIAECVFSGNSAGSDGGAVVCNAGSVIEGCFFENNTAQRSGGAVHMSMTNANPAKVSTSTFSGNTARDSGGGLSVLDLVSSQSKCTVENSTFVGNHVSQGQSFPFSYLGAAAFLDTQATVLNVTAIGNSASDGLSSFGAGIVLANTANSVVEGCLIVGNYQDGTESNLYEFSFPDCVPYSGAVASLVEIPAGTALGDIVEVDGTGDPVLADNGGSVPTVALAPDGPAVDFYEASEASVVPPSVDQRGKARPAGPDGRYDAGAFELQDSDLGRDLTVARLYGADRFETSYKVSTHNRSGADVVVLASGDDGHFPDALAASALSGVENNAPIVLTTTESLSSTARQAIATDLRPSRVIIVGDPYAVSTSVENEVRSILGASGVIERIGGVDRQDTADLIYAAYSDDFSSTAILALAADFPDALSASPWAAKTKSPIFLAHFGGTGLSEKSLAALRNGGFERILVMGSSYSVSNEVASQALTAAGLGYGDYVRFDGIDRYDTSARFAAWAVSPDRDPQERLSMHGAAITRGDKHPDSLTGGALQGRDSSVVLLTQRDGVTVPVESIIDAHAAEIGELRFFGDEYAVALDVVRHYIQRIPYTTITWLPDASVAIL